MIPIVVKLGDGDLGLPLAPLVWALSYGVCLGGNGTLVFIVTVFILTI